MEYGDEFWEGVEIREKRREEQLEMLRKKNRQLRVEDLSEEESSEWVSSDAASGSEDEDPASSSGGEEYDGTGFDNDELASPARDLEDEGACNTIL